MSDGGPTPPQSLEPAILVIFGITGDLSHKYLLPSLYHLFKDELLDKNIEILGVTRGTTTTDELYQKIEQGVKDQDEECDQDALKLMQDQTSMFQMDLEDPKAYKALRAKLDGIETKHGVCMNRLYYLSIPPKAYSPVVGLMGQADLNTSCQHDKAQTRLLVEKPFGFDLESAKELIAKTAEVFSEDQIFRIDHYLAKETVQNILTFRFQNPIFEAIWNHDNIASITISAKEKIGIAGRAVFYEPLGALRDFIQSHLVQIAAIITMDQPEKLSSEAIHKAKQAVMDQMQPVPLSEVSSRVIRGQYSTYKQEVNNAGSTTETYVDMTIYIDSQRWQGVPIRLLTGKALDERKTEVDVAFHSKPDTVVNDLKFRIQPNEGIELDLVTKKPGFDQELENTAMDYSYQTSKDPTKATLPNAYERVLVDAVRGDHTLFATSGEVLASWKVVQPVIDSWSKTSQDLKIYDDGSSGPTRD